MRGFTFIVVLAGCSAPPAIDGGVVSTMDAGGLDAGRPDADRPDADRLDAALPPDATVPRDATADAPILSCAAERETCTDDAQCCNELCDRPGGVEVGTCALIGTCGVAGEPCSPIGIAGASCCSYLCLDQDSDGTPTCQRPPGCLQDEELCDRDEECCTGACLEAGRTADGRPIRRCLLSAPCQAIGTTCELHPSCCPVGDGDFGCVPSATGVPICAGGRPGCSPPGTSCVSTDECCRETFSSITCAVDAWGQEACCLADGEACTHPDVCCGGYCAFAADGMLRCRSTCAPDGDPCSADAECCGCACADGVCSSDPADCGPCTRGDLGERCTNTSDCCEPLRCATESARPTCVIE